MYILDSWGNGDLMRTFYLRLLDTVRSSLQYLLEGKTMAKSNDKDVKALNT